MIFNVDTLMENMGCTRCAMIDLETFDLVPKSGFYAIGARMFTLGQDPGEPDERIVAQPQYIEDSPDFLQYIQPQSVLRDPRFSWSQETMDWTHSKNQVEYDRAIIFGLDSKKTALERLLRWLAHHRPHLLLANSPSFDLNILKHALDVYKLDTLPSFRREFDVRTLREVMHLMGLGRYGSTGEGRRLHSPLDDCTLQILDVNRMCNTLVQLGQEIRNGNAEHGNAEPAKD